MVNGNYAGKVEYSYSLIQAGARTGRVQYDASDNVASWKRYEVDGLLTYRVDERYDSDENGLDSGDPWRVIEKRTYGPGLIGNLLFKEVLKYPDPTSDLNPADRVYYYGYDAVGNVILITEEYCGGTAYKYCFHQDAFGNELQEGWFESDSWSEAEDYGIREHQTGKEFDSFTGLYYYHFRWYDPVVGRFTSRTPLLPSEESAYVYCENDPINSADPNGLVTMGEVWNTIWYFFFPDVDADPFGTAADRFGNRQAAFCQAAGNRNLFRVRNPGEAYNLQSEEYMQVLTTHYAWSAVGGIAGRVSLLGPGAPGGKWFSKNTLRRRLAKLTGKKPWFSHAHHVFPIEFEDIFRDVYNIDINRAEFAVWWSRVSHLRNRHAYNQMWRNFLFDGKKHTTEEVFRMARQIMSSFGQNCPSGLGG